MVAFLLLLQTRQPVAAVALIDNLGGSRVELEAGLAVFDHVEGTSGTRLIG